MTERTENLDDRTVDPPPTPEATVARTSSRAADVTTPAAGDITPAGTIDLPAGGGTIDLPAGGGTITPGTVVIHQRPDLAKDGLPSIRVPGYEILSELGRGGMGVVYKARQVKLHRLVALKMVLAGPHASLDQLTRFRTEAEAVARLQHPNIVQVYDMGEQDGLPYFALEFVEGGPLNKRTNRKPQPANIAAEMVESMARAMDYAHKHNVVHRDLKPANVLVAADGTLKIADFGLAKKLEEEDGQTVSGSIMGTPQYMSPEQASGDIHAIGPATDQYALGAILYELLTGRPPFVAASFLDTLELVRSSEPVPVRQLQPKVPQDLETITLKCLQKEPAKRYPDCTALAADLRRFLAGEPIVARPVGQLERVWRWVKRNPRDAALIGSVAALLVIATGVSTGSWFALRNKNAALAAEKKAAEDARDDAKSQSGLAKKSLETLVNRVPEILGDAIYSQSARIEVMRLIEDIRDQLPEEGDSRGTADRGLIGAHLGQADVFREQGDNAKAEEKYGAALALAEEARADHPTDKSIANLAMVHRAYAEFAQQRLRDAAKARTLAEKAQVLQRGIVDAPKTGEITPAEAKLALAQSCDVLANVEPDPAKALVHCEEALNLRRAAGDGGGGEAETATAKRRLSGTVLTKGRLLARLHRPDEARKAFEEAVALRRELLNAAKGNLRRQRELAFAAADYGDFLLVERDPAAQKLYAESLKLLHTLAAPEEVLRQQQFLAQGYYRSGAAALRAGKTAEAKALFDECLAVRNAVYKERTRDPNFKNAPQVSLRIAIMLALARCGRSAESAQIASNLVRIATGIQPGQELFSHKPDWFVQAACGFALSAAVVDEPEPGWAYLDRALDTLRKAVAAGFVGVDTLDTDPDLDPLREETAFKELVAQVKAKVAKK